MPETGALRAVLSSRSFRLVATSHILSATAQSLPTVALAVYVHQRTHSAGWVAAAAAVRLVPPVFFSALGGLLGDRYDRRRVLLTCNAAAAVATALLGALAAVGAPVAVVLAVAFVAASITTADYPAVVSSTPWLVAPDHLVAANTVVSTVESAAFMVGPGVGGILLVLFSPSIALAAGAVLFLAAAVTVARTQPWDRRSARATGTAVGRHLRDGLEAISGGDARPLVVVLLATELLYGCTIVLLVLVADSPGSAGLLNAAFAAGALSAVLIAAPLARRGRARDVVIAATLASGLPVAALVAVRANLVAYGLLAVAGIASTVVEVHAKTLLQRTVGDDVMARAFGLIDGVACAAILAGSVATPVLVDRVGLTPTLLVVGVLLPALALCPLSLTPTSPTSPRS
ncbi:MAG: MFS transporter [Acidimicrobiales bacterium]